MRLYPSVKWACTELTYEREDTEEEVEVETDEAVATLKALQEYQSKKKDRKNRPQTKMFMKLFRYISGVNKEQDEVAMTAPVHNVLFVQYVFLPTEQTETYFKICILTYDLTYICPGLFDWKENTFFFIFVYFKL